MSPEERRKHDRHAHRHLPHPHIYLPFGRGVVGRLAEKVSDGIGTPVFIVGSTIAIISWIGLNGLGIIARWDPFPFILLNLVFSAQAYYAASLTVLAVKIQAGRQKESDEAAARHRQEESDRAQEELRANTALTRQVESLTQSQNATLEALRTQGGQIAKLTIEVHEKVCKPKKASSSVRSSARSPRSRKRNESSGKSRPSG